MDIQRLHDGCIGFYLSGKRSCPHSSHHICSNIFYLYYNGTVLANCTEDTYEYSAYHGDRLIKYNDKALTYDAIGNLLTYDEYMFTWQGRNLTAAANYSRGCDHQYLYNEYGIRTAKIAGAIREEFTLNGSQVVRSLRTYDGTQTEDIRFYYDADGKLAAMRIYVLNGSTVLNDYTYYFMTNVFGDVLGILDASGNLLVKYSYDAFGTPTAYVKLTSGEFRRYDAADTSASYNASAKLALNNNPFRYRGYFYDTETGLYYLNSRYYNPEWGRFISADDTAYLLSGENLHTINLYAYCNNNPVMYTDSNGDSAVAIIAAIVIGGATAALTAFLDELCDIASGESQSIDGMNILISTGIGMLTGALLTVVPSFSMLISPASSVLESVWINARKGKSLGEIVSEAAVDGIFGLVAGAFSSDLASDSIYDDAFSAFKSIHSKSKGVHPSLKLSKNKANRIMKKARTHFVKTIVSSTFEEVSFWGMGQYSKLIIGG